MSRSSTPHRTLTARIHGTLSDPVLRALVTATTLSTVGRGISITLVVLYLSLIVGLPPEQVALVFTVGAAVAIGASYLGGHLADRISARLLMVAAVATAGTAICCYVFVTELWAAIVVEAVVSFATAMGGSVRSAIIARAFTGSARVTSRAVLRTVTNVGISVGSGLAAVALVLGSPEAYRGVLLFGGLITASSAFLLLRLPPRVDAPPREDVAVSVAAGRSPWRDPRYLMFSALAAIFAMNFAVTTVGVPLWLAHDTSAPEFLLSIMLVTNTVLVIALQIPLSRGTHELRRAGWVSALAGVLMAAACAVYGASGGVVLVLAVAFLLTATVLHAFAEILSQASAWGLSFELADPARPGQYQGVYSMGFSIGSMVAPLIITMTALENGFPGWLLLGGVFLAAGVGMGVLARAAARQQHGRA